MMKQRWVELEEYLSWDRQTASECWAFINLNYSDDSRHYHNLIHISDCLNLLAKCECEDRIALELAIWFHDVIYLASESDNETASGEAAVGWLNLLGEDPDLTEVVNRLINITDHKTEPESADEQLLIDIDLSILGRDPDDYSEYQEQIRKEFDHVSDKDYFIGRSAVLKQFLDRDQIYRTAALNDLFEVQARENIAAEIASLK